MFLHIESSDPLVCDISDHIVQTVSVVPVIICDYNQPHKSSAHSYGEQNLNIIILNNRSNISIIKKIKNNLFAYNDKIIALVNDSDATLPYSPDFWEEVKFLHRFVLIGSDSVMAAFRLNGKTLNMQSYSIDMFNRDSVISHFQKVYDHGLLSLNGTSVRVFLRYAPPWSLLCPADSTKRSYKSLGRDALISELILFSLNATIVITSNVAIVEPYYDQWFKLIDRNNLQMMWLRREIFSDTPITVFNARSV